MRLNRRAFVKAAASLSTLVGGFPAHLVAQSSVNKPPVVSRELRALFETSISIDALLYTQDNAPTLSAETLEAMRVSGQTAAFWDVAFFV